MKKSNRLRNIKPSITMGLAEKIRLYIEQGKDIIPLHLGEPQFSMPTCARDAAAYEALHGDGRYTPVRGLPALRSCVLRKYGDGEFGDNNIIITNGCKQALHELFMVSLNVGDEVVIPRPYWVSYPSMVELAEGKSVYVDMDTDGQLSLASLYKVVSSKTRWILLNSPHNPTGSIYTSATIDSIATCLSEHKDIGVICDDIYADVDQPQGAMSMIKRYNWLKERMVIVNGVSKSYAMMGWRIGYAIGPSDIIDAMSVYQSQSTGNVCSLAQMAAKAALEDGEKTIQSMRRELACCRELVMQELSSFMPFYTPKGGIFAFLDIDKCLGKSTPQGLRIENENDFVDYLLDIYGVACVPGSGFGMSPYLRISYACDTQVLAEGIKRLKNAYSSLS